MQPQKNPLHSSSVCWQYQCSMTHELPGTDRQHDITAGPQPGSKALI